MTLLLRPSFLHVVAACPTSAVLSYGKVSPGNDDTARGNALHFAIAELIRGQPVDAKAILDGYHVEDVTPEALEAAVQWAYTRICQGVQGWQAEVHFEDVGTVDALGIDRDEAMSVTGVVVVDWKSSRELGASPEDREQMLAYSVAAARRFGTTNVGATVAYPFIERMQTFHFDAATIEAAGRTLDLIAARAREQVDKAPQDRDYRPGEWCGHCRADVCPAREAITTLAVRAATAVGESFGQVVIDRSDLPRVWETLGRVEKLRDALKPVVAAEIERGGEITSDAGRLTMQEQTRPMRLSADMVLGWLKEQGHGELADEAVKAHSSLPATIVRFPKFYPPKKSKTKKES